jgi:hypothetical protein
MKNGQQLARAITNKGFRGFSSASLRSNFVSGDTNAAPISLTGHSAKRCKQSEVSYNQQILSCFNEIM